MRKAPSVNYPVGPSFLRSLLYGAALVLGWVVCGGWMLVVRADELVLLVAGVSCLFATACIVWALRRPVQGRLRWDGQSWHWSSKRPGEHVQSSFAEEIPGRVHVRLDWQRGMLLEFAPLSDDFSPRILGWHRNSLWLWVEYREAPAYWNALRRAAWTDAGSGPMQASA